MTGILATVVDGRSTGKPHIFTDRPDGAQECRCCGIRSHWEGARYACTGRNVEASTTTKRKRSGRRKR